MGKTPTLALMDGYFCAKMEAQECGGEHCEGCEQLIVCKCTRVPLTYYKSTGKYYTDGELKVPKCWDIHRVWEFIHKLQEEMRLPGLISGAFIPYVVANFDLEPRLFIGKKVGTLMHVDDFQELAHTTAEYPASMGQLYAIVGLFGEAGEFANKVKKRLRGDSEYQDPKAFKEMIASELGDILWYAAELATNHGLKLSDIMRDNLDKLAIRKAKGLIKGDGDNRGEE